MPADIALRFGPNSARNRKTSLIRRISALGLGTTATPPKRPDSSRDYFDVGGRPSRHRTGEFTGLGWRFPPASGGDYNRPRVAITPGPCSYGDVLTIDATQGLTSTEHIEAMPAGTRPVNVFKAYTAASRHRRSTYLVVSDAAERREIVRRRSLGDPRPIREADVWANIGRNLSRQPEQEGALALLERAHQVRRSATVAMQAGLQPLEQRRVDGQAPTTLMPRLQRQRKTARIRAAAGQLLKWIGGESAVLERLARLAPAVSTKVTHTVEELRPALMQAAERIHERPEWVARRRKVAKPNERHRDGKARTDAVALEGLVREESVIKRKTERQPRKIVVSRKGSGIGE